MRNLLSFGIALVVGAVGGILLFILVSSGSGEPSSVVTAPTLDPNAIPTLSGEQAFALATRVAELEGEVAAQDAQIADLEAASTLEAQPTAAPTATAAPRLLYRIAPGGESEARFTLDEDLRGVRTTVVGSTDQIAGDIVVDLGSPQFSEIGVLRINARTLQTDNDIRDRVTRTSILLSAEDEYEYIEFVPSAIDGLPASIEMGVAYPLQVEGGLTVIGTTLPVIFRGEVTLEEGESLRGLFSVLVTYADWGITVPFSPSASNLDEEVLLELDFVAERVAE